MVTTNHDTMSLIFNDKTVGETALTGSRTSKPHGAMFQRGTMSWGQCPRGGQCPGVFHLYCKSL